MFIDRINKANIDVAIWCSRLISRLIDHVIYSRADV